MAIVSNKMKEFGKFEVGDIVRVGDSDAAQLYIITMKMPAKDPSYYMSIAANGSIATLWEGSIREKVDHLDLEELFHRMEHDLLEGCKGGD